MNLQELLKEFDRQVTNLNIKGYSEVFNLSEQEFLNYINPLRENLEKLNVPSVDFINGSLPFVIVVKTDLISAEVAMSLTEKDGIGGVTILRPHTSENFRTTDDINIPRGVAYLLVNIDRGKDTINLPPSEALKIIKETGRSPLTIEEGIAIITHFPAFLIKNNCFSLLGSRTGKDQRVPAIWINGNKAPNLGWCWDGNPHTWLGSASCMSRIGI